MNGDSKYKLFRNFMVNELGITRDDIKQWTREAVTVEVKKLIGQMDLESQARRAVSDLIKGKSFHGNMSNDMRKIVTEQVAKELSGKLTFKNLEENQEATNE